MANNINITTTGITSSVIFYDLGYRELIHPVTNFSFGNEFTYFELLSSNDFNNQLDLGYFTFSYNGVLVTNSNNLSIPTDWVGPLPLSRGGLANTNFTSSNILVVDSSTSSIVSSGFVFNENAVTNKNLISAKKTIEYNYAFNIIMGY